MQVVDGGRSYDAFFARMAEGRVQLPLGPFLPSGPKKKQEWPGFAFRDYNMTRHWHLRDQEWVGFPLRGR